jgi:hypothetical protein
MAYTIIKSNGTVLTTIPDGTINTTSTSLGLVGKNFAGYGQTIDTNFVRQLENFAASTPPANPLRGQLWYNITNNTMYVCPSDGETDANQWLALTSASESGTTTFGAITVTGNIAANNITLTNSVNAANITALNASITANLTAAYANITTGNVASLFTTVINAGSISTAGTVTGVWSFNGSGNAIIANTGNIYINPSFGIRSDSYMYANGDPINLGGTYNNSNVAAYLPTYDGIVGDGTANVTFRGRQITTGGASTTGNITGNWTLVGSSRLNATYADLAERFEADAVYEPGTVVELGGEKEVTAVKFDLSEDVFGVVSNTAAYLMNSTAGSDETHPPIAIGGRVKVKVLGKVTKGARLVSAGNGIARSATKDEATSFNTIGRALENKTTDEVALIEAVVLIN